MKRDANRKSTIVMSIIGEYVCQNQYYIEFVKSLVWKTMEDIFILWMPVFSTVNKEGCIKRYGRGKVVKAPLRIMPK